MVSSGLWTTPAHSAGARRTVRPRKEPVSRSWLPSVAERSLAPKVPEPAPGPSAATLTAPLTPESTDRCLGEPADGQGRGGTGGIPTLRRDQGVATGRHRVGRIQHEGDAGIPVHRPHLQHAQAVAPFGDRRSDQLPRVTADPPHLETAVRGSGRFGPRARRHQDQTTHQPPEGGRALTQGSARRTARNCADGT